MLKSEVKGSNPRRGENIYKFFAILLIFSRFLIKNPALEFAQVVIGIGTGTVFRFMTS